MRLTLSLVLSLTACTAAAPLAEAQVIPLGGSADEIRRALGLDGIPSDGPVYAGVDIDETTLPPPANYEAGDIDAIAHVVHGQIDDDGSSVTVRYGEVATWITPAGDPTNNSATMVFGAFVFETVEDAQWYMVQLFRGGITSAPRPGPKRARHLGIGDVAVSMLGYHDETIVYILAANLFIEARFGPDYPKADFYSALVTFARYLVEEPSYSSIPDEQRPTIDTIDVSPTPVHAYGDSPDNDNDDYRIHVTASSVDGDPIDSRQMYVEAARGSAGPDMDDNQSIYETDRLVGDEASYVETITVTVVDLRGVIGTRTLGFTVIEPLVVPDDD